jgi:hypothetical protein
MPMDVPFAMLQRFFNVYCLDKPAFIQKDYAGKMSAAPQYTRGQLSQYKKFKSPKDQPGVFYDDQII